VVADYADRRVISPADRGLNASVGPFSDVDERANRFKPATITCDRVLRSEPRARVAIGGDDGSRTAAGNVSVETVRRREPDLDRFVAALLALAVAELDAERADAAE
jgi:hypothetical protein